MIEEVATAAGLGENAQTHALLEEGYRQRGIDMRWLTENAAYDLLRGNPQYQSILRRVGELSAP